MRLSSFWVPCVGLVLAGTLALACSESPTDPGTEAVAPPLAADVDPMGQPFQGPSLHFARVQSNGTLVDGTATGASSTFAGVYLVRFTPSISGCAGTASSAVFPGSSLSSFQVIGFLDIGFDANGNPDDGAVLVQLFRRSDGTRVASSFTLVLVCP